MRTLDGGTVQRWMVAVLLAGTLVGAPLLSGAEDVKLAVSGAQPIRDSLKSLVGSKVALRLTSGEEIGGTVAEVGDSAVRLAELSGRELFDGLVRLDHVSAVIVRKAK